MILSTVFSPEYLSLVKVFLFLFFFFLFVFFCCCFFRGNYSKLLFLFIAVVLIVSVLETFISAIRAAS